MTDHAVFARALAKTYGSFQAVRGIDFEVAPGRCFGFLGPNGAGKTTTMRMTYLASRPTSGTLSIFGEDLGGRFDVYALKRRIGVVPQEDNLDQELTALETLEVFCRFYGLYGRKGTARARELLDYVHLGDKAGAKVLQLSGGMRRRLQIARGLIGAPELFILDEPTTGLDPQMRNQIWDALKELKRRSVTMLLTTHYMHEAEQLCDDLVVMDGGRIVARGHPRELIREHVPPYVVEVIHSDRVNAATAWLNDLRAKASYASRLADRDLIYTDDSDALLRAIQAHAPGVTAYIRYATLEDVFLRITGKTLEGGAA